MSGRIRTIKPEWLEDERLALASANARVMSIGLILLADDFGNGRAHPALLRSRVLPLASREELFRALAELEGWFVSIYEQGGQQYFSIRNWGKHQRVDKPGKPRVPPPGGPPEPRREPPIRTAYFARGRTTGLIKIGSSIDPVARLVDLSRQSPETFELLAVGGVESELHAELAADRVHGEWFRESSRVLAKIREYGGDPETPIAVAGYEGARTALVLAGGVGSVDAGECVPESSRGSREPPLESSRGLAPDLDLDLDLDQEGSARATPAEEPADEPPPNPDRAPPPAARVPPAPPVGDSGMDSWTARMVERLRTRPPLAVLADTKTPKALAALVFNNPRLHAPDVVARALDEAAAAVLDGVNAGESMPPGRIAGYARKFLQTAARGPRPGRRDQVEAPPTAAHQVAKLAPELTDEERAEMRAAAPRDPSAALAAASARPERRAPRMVVSHAVRPQLAAIAGAIGAGPTSGPTLAVRPQKAVVANQPQPPPSPEEAESA